MLFNDSWNSEVLVCCIGLGLICKTGVSLTFTCACLACKEPINYAVKLNDLVFCPKIYFGLFKDFTGLGSMLKLILS